VPIAPTRAEIVDEFGSLDSQIRLLTPRHTLLKTQIQAWFADHKADQPAEARGLAYCVQLSPRKSERTVISKWKCFLRLRKLVGLKATVELVNFPLTDAIDKHIPEAEHKLFLVKAHTGSRTVTAVALPPEAA